MSNICVVKSGDSQRDGRCSWLTRSVPRALRRTSMISHWLIALQHKQQPCLSQSSSVLLRSDTVTLLNQSVLLFPNLLRSDTVTLLNQSVLPFPNLLRSDTVTLLNQSVLPFPSPIQSYQHDFRPQPRCSWSLTCNCGLKQRCRWDLRSSGMLCSVVIINNRRFWTTYQGSRR
jgi:hypothetical protein